jgi:hypothetical protein
MAKEAQHQKADWIDEIDRHPSGVPTCRHCNRLICEHPRDHAPGCFVLQQLVRYNPNAPY